MRFVYSDELDHSWANDQVKAYWYCRRLFAHIARMHYILHQMPERFGIHRKEANEFLSLWMLELETRLRTSEIMRQVVIKAIETGTWNTSFLIQVKKLLHSDSVVRDVQDSSAAPQ